MKTILLIIAVIASVVISAIFSGFFGAFFMVNGKVPVFAMAMVFFACTIGLTTVAKSWLDTLFDKIKSKKMHRENSMTNNGR